MKKVTIYEVSKNEINKLEAFMFLHPKFSKEVYVLSDEETAMSVFISEFEEYNYFLSKSEAEKYIESKKSEDELYLKMCIEFHNYCEKTQRGNPFMNIGENRIRFSNKKAISEINDPVLNCFLNSKLATFSYLNDLEEAIQIEIEKDDH